MLYGTDSVIIYSAIKRTFNVFIFAPACKVHMKNVIIIAKFI